LPEYWQGEAGPSCQCLGELGYLALYWRRLQVRTVAASTQVQLISLPRVGRPETLMDPAVAAVAQRVNGRALPVIRLRIVFSVRSNWRRRIAAHMTGALVVRMRSVGKALMQLFELENPFFRGVAVVVVHEC